MTRTPGQKRQDAFNERLRAIEHLPYAEREAFKAGMYAGVAVADACPPGKSSRPEAVPPAHGVTYATVRDGGDEWHIECRMADGQKGAFVRVDKECEGLADAIAAYLRRPQHGDSSKEKP